MGYCSLSEAVLGVLLERFIEGFKVQFRENFQVPIGNGRSVDFCINGVLVEYHPVRLRAEKRRHGDFGSRGEYFRFSRQLKKIGKRKKHARNEFLSKTKHHLTRKYFSKRRHFIDQTPALRGFELVVASTLEEFYQKVIRRFATGNPPPFELFSELFATEVKIIAKSINYPSQK